MLLTWTFQQRQSSILMTFCALIIEDYGMKPRICETRKKNSYFTVNGTVRIWLEEKGPYSIIKHIDDLRELFPDKDFSMFWLDCIVSGVQIVNICLDNCVRVWVTELFEILFVLWSVEIQCCQIWTYFISMVRKLNAEQFLQKKCMLKVSIIKVILKKHMLNMLYTDIYAHICEVRECKCCLSESLWDVFIFWKSMKQVLHRVVLYLSVNWFQGYGNHICWETKFTLYLSI